MDKLSLNYYPCSKRFGICGINEDRTMQGYAAGELWEMDDSDKAALAEALGLATPARVTELEAEVAELEAKVAQRNELAGLADLQRAIERRRRFKAEQTVADLRVQLAAAQTRMRTTLAKNGGS